MQVIDLFTLIGNNGELHEGQNTGCDRCHFGQPTLTAEIGPWLRDLPAGDRGYRWFDAVVADSSGVGCT
jgi:hypothetical protein